MVPDNVRLLAVIVTALPLELRDRPLLTVTVPVPLVVREIGPLVMILLLTVIDPLPAVVWKLKLAVASGDAVVPLAVFRNTVPAEERLTFCPVRPALLA